MSEQAEQDIAEQVVFKLCGYQSFEAKRLVLDALRAVHDRAYENAEKFLLDHYWDSIEDKKDLLNLHIKACFRRLRKDDK